MRDCPVCHTAMRPFHAESLDLDACPTCFGLWFDAGELQHLVPPVPLDDALSHAALLPGRCRECEATIDIGTRCDSCGTASCQCPKCSRTLSVVELKGVPIDVCAQCDGVWLDAGELMLLTMSTSAAAVVQSKAFPRRVEESVEDAKNAPERCGKCQKELKRINAFQKKGKTYCGSCAPRHSAPMIGIHTRRESTSETGEAIQDWEILDVLAFVASFFD